MTTIKNGDSTQIFNEWYNGHSFFYDFHDELFIGYKVNDHKAVFFDTATGKFFIADRYSNCFMNRPNCKNYSSRASAILAAEKEN